MQASYSYLQQKAKMRLRSTSKVVADIVALLLPFISSRVACVNFVCIGIFRLNSYSEYRRLPVGHRHLVLVMVSRVFFWIILSLYSQMSGCYGRICCRGNIRGKV